jgi:hypothetical protein
MVSRSRYNELKQNHLCVRCKNPNINKNVYCDKCKKIFNEFQRKRDLFNRSLK